MPTLAASATEPDPALLKNLVAVRRVCLAAAGALALLNLCGWVISALGFALAAGWQWMAPGSALAVLCGALSLSFSGDPDSRRRRRLSLWFAILVVLLGATVAAYRFHIFIGFDRLVAGNSVLRQILPVRTSPETFAGLALLGIATMLIRARKQFAARAADLLVFVLSLAVLTLVSGYLFGAMRIFGLSSSGWSSPQTLLCLLLLTVAAVLQRAESGVLAIFLGRGIGSKLARILFPILLVLPFLREVSRARLVQANVLPAHYVTALLASIATVLSFALLLFLAWRINAMEKEIHDLTLRDELTGLYNLRGFQLLAEQARRLAHRSQLPFSVLFVDLDNLKQINDALGHSTGSAFLSETGQMLNAIFRETDVMARIGGDEFAVAGQFGHVAISIAAQRLQDAAGVRNRAGRRRLPLSLSIGYATCEDTERESLQHLLIRADAAMYEEKRRKKLQPV